MKTKEKAKRLVEKFYKKIDYKTRANFDIKMEVAKECALICVDEIKESLRYVLDFSGEESLLYWDEVKKEIEKI